MTADPIQAAPTTATATASEPRLDGLFEQLASALHSAAATHRAIADWYGRRGAQDRRDYHWDRNSRFAADARHYELCAVAIRRGSEA